MPLTVIEGELIDIEEDLFLQKEVLIRDSNSTLKPLLFNNLGNEISNTDPSLARSFYIETLLEVSSNNSGDEQIKKQAVTKACSGIIWTMAKNLVTTDSDQELTNHEIKLLNYLLGLSTPNWTLGNCKCCLKRRP